MKGETSEPGVKGGAGLIAVLGDAAVWACHLLRTTLLFLLLLGCIYFLRVLVVMVFAPGEYLRELLEVVDTYAVLLGTLGYITWMSVDAFFLMKERGRRRNLA